LCLGFLDGLDDSGSITLPIQNPLIQGTCGEGDTGWTGVRIGQNEVGLDELAVGPCLPLTKFVTEVWDEKSN